MKCRVGHNQAPWYGIESGFACFLTTRTELQDKEKIKYRSTTMKPSAYLFVFSVDKILGNLPEIGQ